MPPEILSTSSGEALDQNFLGRVLLGRSLGGYMCLSAQTNTLNWSRVNTIDRQALAGSELPPGPVDEIIGRRCLGICLMPMEPVYFSSAHRVKQKVRSYV